MFIPPLLVAASVSVAAALSQYDVQELAIPVAPASAITSVAMDHGTAVVGLSRSYSASGDELGKALIFTQQPDGHWSQAADLAASDGAKGDSFGNVAVSENTVIVGAYGHMVAGPLSGSAYVYVRDSSGLWYEQAKLSASDASEFDFFGWSVGISGGTAVVGAWGSGEEGAAYVYEQGESGAWEEQQRLVPTNGGTVRNFGSSVAISEDLIAALGFAQGAGTVFIFERDASGNWIQQATLRWEGGGFGSLAISGDLVVAGAPSDSGGRGAAVVYARDPGGGWSLHTTLTPSDATAEGHFGRSVALADDTILVGASLGNFSGKAYVFARGANDTWNEETMLLPRESVTGRGFGLSIAASGHEAIISAREFAYSYLLGQPRPALSLECPGDINGDGRVELAVTTSAELVQVKDVAGVQVTDFEIAQEIGPGQTRLMPDSNPKASVELVALDRFRAEAGIWDLLSGGYLGEVSFDNAPVDFAVTSDWTGNGFSEVSSLGTWSSWRSPATVETRDSATNQLISSVGVSPYVDGRELMILPELNRNGVPEMAVLSENHRHNAQDKVEILDAGAGSVDDIWLGIGWRMLQQQRIDDLNGNGSDEIAVLRVHPSGNVNVQIRDGRTRAWLNFIGFAVAYPPEHLVAISDINGNGASELVVFGRHIGDNHQKAVIKDSRTGQKLGQLMFDMSFVGQDFVDCGDINGNGAADLALLGQRRSDSALKVTVRDSLTAEYLADVWF